MPYYRRNLYILSTTIFLAAVSWNQIVPFFPQFLRELGVKHNLIRWSEAIFACQSVAAIVALPLWGKLGDSYGRKPMIIRAGICLSSIYFLTSICQNPWQVAICRFLNGALTGFIPGSMTLIATNTPGRLAPRAVATTETAAAAGLIIGPAIGGILTVVLGFRGAMRFSGTTIFLCTLLVIFFVQEPNKVKPTEKTSLLDDFVIAFKSPILTSLMLAMMVLAMFGCSINPVLTIHLADIGGRIPKWFAGGVFSLPAAGFVIMARRWTRIGEKKGFHKTVLSGLVGGGIGAFSLAFAHGIWLFAGLYFMAGLWLAAVSPSAGAIACTRIEETFRGRAYGMMQASTMTGALLGPLLAGQIGGNYGIPAIFILVGILYLTGAFVFATCVKRWPKAG